jgi:preprotein translocase subunit SecG
MSWIIGILTFILVVDCLLLVLLILVQLPKKEAGLGTAFGSGTTDALFGAGTGNALTKMTKYCTGIFFVLTLSLSILNANQTKAKREFLQNEMQKLESGKIQDALKNPSQAPDQPKAPPAVTNPLSTLTTTVSNLVPNLTNKLLQTAPAPAPAPPTNAPSQPGKSTPSSAPAPK